MANDRIRAVLGRVARLPVPVASLHGDTDLHEAGMTSFGTVELMMALEEEFEVEFPEDLVARARFGSIDAICDTLRLAAAR